MGRLTRISVNFSNPDLPLLLQVCPRALFQGPFSSWFSSFHLEMLFTKYGIDFNCYGDDTQLYLTNQPSSNLPLSFLIECIGKIKFWLLSKMFENYPVKLKLRSTCFKTDSFFLTIYKCSFSLSFGSRVVHDSCLVFTIKFQQLSLVFILPPMALEFTTRNMN